MDELELILTDICNCSRADLYSNSSTALKEREFARLDKILKNRAKHIPLQYILGYAEFMGLRFQVQKGVLIPRPETEILAEEIIDRIRKAENINQKTEILDIGTGSGCIAISLAKFLKNVHIIAVDISKQAINLASENAKSHNVKGISFIEGDFFSLIEARHYYPPLKIRRVRLRFVANNGGRRLSANALVADASLLHKRFDIIVTNPPYVSTSEIGMFDKTTACEPRIALDGGKDGLAFYRRLSKSTGALLKKDGFLIMEIGYNQAQEIKKIFSCGWDIENVIKDYQGIERIMVIRRENNG